MERLRNFYLSVGRMNRILSKPFGKLRTIAWVSIGLLVLAGIMAIPSLWFNVRPLAIATILIFFLACSILVFWYSFHDTRITGLIRSQTHNSYFRFVSTTTIYLVFSIIVLLYVFTYIFEDLSTFLRNHLIEISVVLAGLQSIYWFGFQIVSSEKIGRLRVNLQMYTVIAVIFQYFVPKTDSSRYFLISFLVCCYGVIRYFFELKNLEEERQKIEDERRKQEEEKKNSFG